MPTLVLGGAILVNTELIPVADNAPFAILENGLILNRESGEVVALQDAPDQTLAALDEQLRSQRDWYRETTAIVEDVLKARLKAAGARTLDAGTHIVELERKREWDVEATWAALEDLVELGHISIADADAACPKKTKRAPDGRKLNSILLQVIGDDPEAAQALSKARTERTYIKLARTSVEGTVAE